MIAVCKMSLKLPLLDDALAACNEAIELRPSHSPAYYRRSQVPRELGPPRQRPSTPIRTLTLILTFTLTYQRSLPLSPPPLI